MNQEDFLKCVTRAESSLRRYEPLSIGWQSQTNTKDGSVQIAGRVYFWRYCGPLEVPRLREGESRLQLLRVEQAGVLFIEPEGAMFRAHDRWRAILALLGPLETFLRSLESRNAEQAERAMSEFCQASLLRLESLVPPQTKTK